MPSCYPPCRPVSRHIFPWAVLGHSRGLQDAAPDARGPRIPAAYSAGHAGCACALHEHPDGVCTPRGGLAYHGVLATVSAPAPNRTYPPGVRLPSLRDKLLRLGGGKILKTLHGIAAQVNALEESVADLSDEELRAETDQFKERLAEGATLDELMPEAFAVVREAAQRTLGQRHFDVQIMGGAALHLGNIAEM